MRSAIANAIDVPRAMRAAAPATTELEPLSLAVASRGANAMRMGARWNVAPGRAIAAMVQIAAKPAAMPSAAGTWLMRFLAVMSPEKAPAADSVRRVSDI
jgi:hypothetical protein